MLVRANKVTRLSKENLIANFVFSYLDLRFLLSCSFFDWGRGHDCCRGLVRDGRVNLHWLGLFDFDLFKGVRLGVDEVSCWLHWHW